MQNEKSKKINQQWGANFIHWNIIIFHSHNVFVWGRQETNSARHRLFVKNAFKDNHC